MLAASVFLSTRCELNFVSPVHPQVPTSAFFHLPFFHFPFFHLPFFHFPFFHFPFFHLPSTCGDDVTGALQEDINHIRVASPIRSGRWSPACKIVSTAATDAATTGLPPLSRLIQRAAPPTVCSPPGFGFFFPMPPPPAQRAYPFLCHVPAHYANHNHCLASYDCSLSATFFVLRKIVSSAYGWQVQCPKKGICAL
jgi:hypothetical protein